MADPADETDEVQVDEATMPATDRRGRRRVGAAVLVLLAAATAMAGWRDVQTRRTDAAHAQMLAAGREGALALTNVDHTEVDRDVQRILDASTGAFYDDFAQRAETFKAAARKAQSTSVGTVREAGLESVDGDTAQVLVALSVMTSNRGEPAKQPTLWRTRVTVDKADDGFKVSSVEFVA
ncbi:MAG: mammalian cell entry protein [Mycobacterium sp.]